MEYALPELLTREKLLAILHERKLKVPNMEQLSQDELMRLYKSFALPLARRETPHGSSNRRRTGTDAQCKTQTQPMQLDSNFNVNHRDCIIEANMEIDNMALNDCESILTVQLTKMHCGSAKKRPQEYKVLDTFSDENLCSATKRIKIAWP